MPGDDKPTNKALYERVKAEARNKFHKYPSLYANAWVVREYKRRGGGYSGSRKSSDGVRRWFRERWVDVCDPKGAECGREAAARTRAYPYCRPTKKVSAKTPRLAQHMSKAEKERLCARKRSHPKRRMPVVSRNR